MNLGAPQVARLEDSAIPIEGEPPVTASSSLAEQNASRLKQSAIADSEILCSYYEMKGQSARCGRLLSEVGTGDIAMRLAFFASAVLALSACAKTPPVNYLYYPATGKVFVTTVQAVDCSKDHKNLIVVTATPTVTVKYGADYEAGPWTLEASRLRGRMANQDFTVTRYEDGRLKGINLQSTGQGEAILKSVISLISAVVPFVGGSAAPDGSPLPECATVASAGGGKPVTLNYLAVHDMGSLSSAPVSIEPAPELKPLHDALNVGNRLPRLQAKYTIGAKSLDAGADQTPTARHVKLRLQTVANGSLEILSQGTPIWRGELAIPQPSYYELPIPNPAAFGKTTMALDVAESGVVTKLQYAGETGVAGPLNVLTAAGTSFAPNSSAEQANELKAKADLIAQTQRLARCRAQPDECV